MCGGLRFWLKAHVPRPLWDAAKNAYLWCRAQRPTRFAWVVYRLDAVAEPDLSDVSVDVVELRAGLTPEQRAFILRDLTEPSLRSSMHSSNDGWECVYLARCDGVCCNYLFCKSVARYRRGFPVLTGAKARIIGPAYTAPEFRGRNIYPRMMQHTIADGTRRGYGPFYCFVYTWNSAAQKAMDKAGWQRLGVWSGITALAQRWFRCRRVGD